MSIVNFSQNTTNLSKSGENVDDLRTKLIRNGD